MSDNQQDPIECRIAIAMNEHGAWIVVDDTSDNAVDQLNGNEGGEVFRTVKIVVKMRPPKAAQVEITVPDEAGETITAEAAE